MHYLGLLSGQVNSVEKMHQKLHCTQNLVILIVTMWLFTEKDLLVPRGV
jgi:hypothetical protein